MWPFCPQWFSLENGSMPFLLLARFPGRWTSLLSALLRCLGNLKGRMKTGKSEKTRSVISLESAPQEAPWACEQQSQGRAGRWQQLLHLHCCFLCCHILVEMLIQRTEVFLRTSVPALRIRSTPGGLLHDLLWEVSIYVNQGL